MFSKVLGKIKSTKLDKTFLFTLIAIIGFLAVIVYVYKKYMKPKLNPQYVANKEFVKESYMIMLSYGYH